MKPCIVIVLDTLFKQAPWPGAPWPSFSRTTDFDKILRRVQKIYVESRNKVHFLAASGSCEDETLHSN